MRLMTTSAIGTSNMLHWSLWGCFTRCDTDNDFVSEWVAWITMRVFTRETVLSQSLPRHVDGPLHLSYPFLKEINRAFYSLSISDRRDWSIGAESPRPARTVGRRLSGTSTTCAPCTFFCRFWRWQLPCRPQNLCSLKMIGENQVSAEPIWIHCSPNKWLCIS